MNLQPRRNGLDYQLQDLCQKGYHFQLLNKKTGGLGHYVIFFIDQNKLAAGQPGSAIALIYNERGEYVTQQTWGENAGLYLWANRLWAEHLGCQL